MRCKTTTARSSLTASRAPPTGSPRSERASAPAAGTVADVNLLDSVHARDIAIDQAAEQAPSDLLRTALIDHERTVKTLRSVDPGALRRTIRIDGETTMTAEELARLPLINHLEAHIEQLERSLGS